MAKKLTYKEVKKIFEDANCELISKEYINSKLPLSFRCSCGRNDSKTLEKFKSRNPFCKECSKEKRLENSRLSIDDVRLVFEKNGCQLIETNYVNTKTRMKCVCICGEIKYLKYEDVVNGRHCRECSFSKTAKGLLKYTINDVSSMFEKEGCMLLSKIYRGVNSNVRYICSCGNKSEIRLSAFMSGQKCRKCYIENNTGENSRNWKPEKTDEERVKERAFREYDIWRKRVFERDNYMCDSCGQRGGRLAAHHLDGWHWCKEKRLDLDNGTTLCVSCHDAFHKIYTNFNNTREQFNEWLRNKERKRDAM
jgi:hypothetical protein